MGVTSTKSLKFIVFGKSDIGMVREENQDSFCIQSADTQELESTRGQLLIVADGMGGLAHGGQASQIAVNTVQGTYFQREGDFSQALVKSVEEANTQIFKEAQQLPGNQPMGSTITSMVVVDNSAVIAQVGDSRAYRISEEEGLKQLTHDHTLVQELADRGEIEPDSLHYLMNRSVLTRGLGLQDDVEVDSFEIAEIRPGDTFLLCSDGLYDVVADSEIESHVLTHGREVEDLINNLLELARNRGAPDNVTILVIRAESSSPDDSKNSLSEVNEQSEEAKSEALKKVSGSFVTPLSYFLVFALGALLTLLLQDNNNVEKPFNEELLDIKSVHVENIQIEKPIPQTVEDLFNPESQEILKQYFKESQNSELRKELERFLEWGRGEEPEKE